MSTRRRGPDAMGCPTASQGGRKSMRRQHFAARTSVVIGVVATGLWLAGSAHGGQYTEIVSFGDSLTDVGNFAAATGGASPPALYGYYQGRFANGWNWVD